MQQNPSQMELVYQEHQSNQRLFTNQNIQSNEILRNQSHSKKSILPPIRGNRQSNPDGSDAKFPKRDSQRETSISPIKDRKRKMSLEGVISDDYKLANYETSKLFFKTEGYFEKVIKGSHLVYEPASCSNQNIDFLKIYHSTGVYFYFQFLKRALFLLFFCSCLSALQLYNNYVGTKLSAFSKTFSTTLAYLSLGNSNGDTEFLMYVQCCMATLQALSLIVFYIQWRIASNQTLNEYLQDPSIVEPQRYALLVSGITHTSSPQTLAFRFKNYLKCLGFNIFECEVILDYDNNFNDYIKLQKKINEVEQMRCLLQQKMGSEEKLEEIRNEKSKLQDEIENDNTPLKPLYIIVHFETKLDKAKFIHAQKYSSKENNCCASFSRCFCCFKPRQNQLFEDQLVLLESETIGRPDDIYWENMDATFGSRIWRILLGIIIIFVTLVITSTVIACCILYASGASNCSQYNPGSLLADVTGDQTLLYCFCEQNILSFDSAISTACGRVNRTILINNALLIVSSVASALSNVVLGIVVELMISFMKPKSRSKEYESNFVIIIIATLINSCFLPLVLNASIFGYTPNAYLRIFNFINFTNVKIVSDFTPEWYVFISPYYVNLFLVAIILPWVNLFKCMIVNSIRRCRIKRNINQTLQKTADSTIIGYKFDMASQNALIIVNTLICFTYSTSLPVLPILHFFSICSLLITNKICLLKYSRRVSLDEQLNNIIIHLFPFMIILNICFSIWALTAQTLFPVSFFSKTSFEFSVLGDTEFRRAFYFLPLTACLALVVGFILIDYILIRLFGLCCKNNAIYPESMDPATFFSHKSKDKSVLNSYRFIKNPDYKHVIKIVEAMIRKRFNKQ